MSSEDDPFSDTAGARLAKTSKHQYLFGWRRFLGFLALNEPDALDLAPGLRLSIDRVKRFVRHLSETNIPRSVAIQTDALYKAARVMMPERDWAWLKAVKTRLYSVAPAGRANGPIVTSLQLLDLGQRLMDDLGQDLEHSISPGRAAQYRDGLMLALLAFVPIRRKNLASIEIGRHLIREGAGWFIVIQQSETKTNTAIEFAIPSLLDSHLVTYLEDIRPQMLRGQKSSALWVTQRGGALSYSAIGEIIGQRTSTGLGTRIAPHDARDAAVTTWAILAPDKIGVARDLLAHDNLRTTTKHYNRARGVQASRAHAQLIHRRRGQAKGRV